MATSRGGSEIVEKKTQVYFKDMTKEDGSQFTEEEINDPGFFDFITDLWHGLTGTKAKSKNTGKRKSTGKSQKTVNKYLDGGA